MEELFDYEMDDINVPGMMHGFIYDEFHPDPVYDNSGLVQQDLLHDIFRKEELFCEIDYVKNGFIFNNKQFDDYTEYAELINRFKSVFDEIELLDSAVNNCQVNKTDCAVKGNYKAMAKTQTSEMIFEGEFKVDLILDELSYWNMKGIQIDGFNPQ